MLSFFFHRFSTMVLLMEGFGVIGMALAAVRIVDGASVLSQTLLALVLCEYAFIRFCASRRWYRDAPRWSGIELQFKKALVPTSYAMAIAGPLALLLPPAIPLFAAALLLAIVAHVNIILLFFHVRDHDPTPVNFFSRSES